MIFIKVLFEGAIYFHLIRAQFYMTMQFTYIKITSI